MAALSSISFPAFALLGFSLSLYAAVVEQKAKRNKSYRALCDFSEKMSCTRTFARPEARLFGISNAVLGVLFYSVLLLLFVGGGDGAEMLLFALTFIAVIGSLYLLYLQMFRIKIFCLVCTFIYGINGGLFLIAGGMSGFL